MAKQEKQMAREEKARMAEEERVERLEKQLTSWRAASEIRAFVREARELFECGEGPPTQKTNEYLNWALKRADALDPLRDIRRAIGHANGSGRSSASLRDGVEGGDEIHP
jgi:hypothetical protein